MLLDYLNYLRSNTSEEEFNRILNQVDINITVIRVRAKKRTTAKQFINITENVRRGI